MKFVKTISMISLLMNSAVADDILGTQELLQDSAQREEFIKGSADAQKADQLLKQLAGSPEMSQDLYLLASSIFGTLATETKDANALKKMIESFQTNPQALEGKLTPGQKQVLKRLAEKLERDNPALRKTP